VYEVEIKHKDGTQYCISRTYDEFQNLHKTVTPSFFYNFFELLLSLFGINFQLIYFFFHYFHFRRGWGC
jgi:hypothetical protein